MKHFSLIRFKWQLFSFGLALGALSQVTAAGHEPVILLSFEEEDAAARLPYRERRGTTLDIADRYATDGRHSLRFRTPVWSNGLPEWPSFEFRVPQGDWRAFDRLAMDVVNHGTSAARIEMFVSDSKVPFREGLYHHFTVPSRAWRRIEVPLAKLPSTVNRGDISILHIFVTRPDAEWDLYLDRIALLRPCETSSPPSAEFVREIAPLYGGAIEDLSAKLDRLRDVRETPWFAALREELDRFRTETSSPEAPTRDVSAWLDRREALSLAIARAEELAMLTRNEPADAAANGLVLAVASAMQKILPRAGRMGIEPAGPIEVHAARGETESAQVIVTTLGREPLRGVEVSVGDLKTEGGVLFEPGHVQCDVVGYVRTRERPPYGTTHIGWWPDPILNFLGSIEIQPGDLQAFWIRVRPSRGQAAGVYRGMLTFKAANAAPRSLPISVHVRDWTMPAASPLPLAITFAPHDHPLDSTRVEQESWRREPDYPINLWRQRRDRWAEFLGDYFITFDSLYHHEQPAFDLLTRLREQGRLGRFNLGYWYFWDDSPGAEDRWRTNTLARLSLAWSRARELGLLDQAYLYGCDEVDPEHFERVERAAATLKRELPGVPVFTTTRDKSYGLESPIKSVDWWCPLTPDFDPQRAARARATGRQVWWYICCGPHHPYANMFIEYPAIEARLLMGAMTAKYRPDGFLYYQISIWNSRRPIFGGPFTDWDPRSWTTYHGDGSWTCVGPGGEPVPTIRLENFRDGLEDYAAVLELERRLKESEAAGEAAAAWREAARAALNVPEELVRSLKEFSRDPAVLLAWRRRLDDLIEAAPRPSRP